jgi:hypothetical protein
MKVPRVIVRPALNVALVDVCEEHCRVFKEACVAAGYSPVFKATCDVCTDGLGRWADLIVIESDLCFRALHSADKARRCGTCPVGVLVNWWSDLERDAGEAADFVIHVPLTAGEIRHVLAAVPIRPSHERTVTPSPGQGARRCSRAAREGHSGGGGQRALEGPQPTQASRNYSEARQVGGAHG